MKTLASIVIMGLNRFKELDILKNQKHTEEIALDIISGESFTTIATKYNLSTKTIYRLRQSDEFQALLKEQKKKCFESALNQASYLSLSNMPVETSVFEEDGWVTDHFSQTPLMSTYYLAWAICNFTYRETTTKSGVVVSILSLMLFLDNIC